MLHAWLRGFEDKGRFFKLWVSKGKTRFVKKHPSNPFENELIHEGVNECFEVEERQLEGHSGASIYDLFNQRLETSCNEAFNAVISKKGFGAEFLGSMLKE